MDRLRRPGMGRWADVSVGEEKSEGGGGSNAATATSVRGGERVVVVGDCSADAARASTAVGEAGDRPNTSAAARSMSSMRGTRRRAGMRDVAVVVGGIWVGRSCGEDEVAVRPLIAAAETHDGVQGVSRVTISWVDRLLMLVEAVEDAVFVWVNERVASASGCW